MNPNGIAGYSKAPAIARLVVFLASLLPFLRTLSHGFIAVDDQIHTYLNPFLNGRAAGGVWRLWHSSYMGLYIPVTDTAWALIHALEGGGSTWYAWPFHLTNLTLHALNGLIAFELLRYLLSSHPLSSPSLRRAKILGREKHLRIVMASTLGALFFTLHPLQVEPVAWVSGLNNVLCGTFSLLSLLLFLRSGPGREKSLPLGFVSSLACMALAVLSKPSAVMLPVLGFTLALLITPSKRARWAIRAILAVLFVSVPAILVTSGAQPIPEENFVAPLWARPLVALDGLAFYLYKTGFPVGLTLSYGRTPRSVLFTHSWAYWTWILPVVLLLALGLALRRNGPWSALAPVSSIGFGFFCLGFFPVLGLVPFHYQTWSTVSDRYAYLSLLGPSLIVAFVMSRAAEMKWPRLAVGVLPLLIIGLGAMSYTQAGYWHDTLTVARRMLEVAPDNEMSQSTAGEAQTAAGELDEAADHLERSLRLSEPSEIPNYIFELGLVRHLQGRISEAAELYKRAISRRPSVAGAQNNLGVILLMGGQSAEAALYFEAAIQFDPLRSAEPYFNLARATEQLPGQAEKARALFQRAIQLQPGIEENETSLLWRLRGHKPREIGFNTELRLMWPYGYPVPGSREGY